MNLQHWKRSKLLVKDCTSLSGLLMKNGLTNLKKIRKLKEWKTFEKFSNNFVDIQKLDNKNLEKLIWKIYLKL